MIDAATVVESRVTLRSGETIANNLTLIYIGSNMDKPLAPGSLWWLTCLADIASL
jgi:hypothetical protein